MVLFGREDVHDSSLEAAEKPVKDGERKTKDCMH